MSWQQVNLDDVANVISGIGFPIQYQGMQSGEFPFFKVGDISRAVRNNQGYLSITDNYVSLEVCKRLGGKPIQPGSTVFAKIGEALKLNRRAFVKIPSLVDNNVMAVKAFDSQLDRYIYFFLMSCDFTEYSRSTTVPSLRKGDIESIKIPLPPLNEQKRIADKLDTLLGRVDACRERLDRLPGILKRFRQAVLSAAVSGRLTVDVETNNVEYLPLFQVLDRIRTGPFGSTLHRSDYVLNGIPVVNPMHINNGKITTTETMSITQKKAKELSEFRLIQGDVVLGRRGVMGRCAVIGKEQEGWLCGSGSMMLHPNKRVLPTYLQIFLSSPESVDALESNSVGSTMSNLNQKIMLDLIIRVPDVTVQTGIVQRVDMLLSFADRLEARLQVACRQVDALTPALLAKAFRGELVLQDPNDEPASVLLERIRTERENSTARKPGR